MRRAMTTISKRLWIEGTVLHMLQLQARLVTSSLVRTFPGPSGYEVKSQGASLEATCKHVEVAKSVTPGWDGISSQEWTSISPKRLRRLRGQ